MAFFPRFLAGLSLRATYQLEQTCGAAAKIDIVAGGKFSRLRQKTVRVRGIENELPLDVFLPRENERDRLIVRVDQQQECVVANWFTLETETRRWCRRSAACQGNEQTATPILPRSSRYRRD